MTKLAKLLRERLEGSIFLKGNREDIAGLPGTIDELLHGLEAEIKRDSLPAEMDRARGHGTEDEPVISLRLSAECAVQGFSRLFPALSAVLAALHTDEILTRIKKEGRPEDLWTPRMVALAERLPSISERWRVIADRKVRGKTAQTKWLLEVCRVLTEANSICVEILTAIIEAGIEGVPW